MKEVQWFYARYTASRLRMEQRNIGLVLRYPDKEIVVRFLGESKPTYVGHAFQGFDEPLPLFVRSPKLYEGWVRYWREQLAKYGSRAMHWLPKRGKGPESDEEGFGFIVGGGRLVGSGGVDFGVMFSELVEPECETCGGGVSE